MKIYLFFFFFALVSHPATAQQQSAAEMQDQMNAADVPQSAANTVTYKTPLKTYQQYYAAFIGINFKAMAETYSAAFKKVEFDGKNPSDEDYAKMSAKFKEFGDTDFQLLSFVFTPNVAMPKITFVFSSSRSQTPSKDKVELTMIDTPDGWKIDSIMDEQK